MLHVFWGEEEHVGGILPFPNSASQAEEIYRVLRTADAKYPNYFRGKGFMFIATPRSFNMDIFGYVLGIKKHGVIRIYNDEFEYGNISFGGDGAFTLMKSLQVPKKNINGVPSKKIANITCFEKAGKAICEFKNVAWTKI